MHLVKNDGTFIAMKANIDEEVKESKKSMNRNNCNIKKIECFNLPNEESIRNLIVIMKK